MLLDLTYGTMLEFLMRENSEKVLDAISKMDEELRAPPQVVSRDPTDPADGLGPAVND